MSDYTSQCHPKNINFLLPFKNGYPLQSVMNTRVHDVFLLVPPSIQSVMDTRVHDVFLLVPPSIQSVMDTRVHGVIGVF